MRLAAIVAPVLLAVVFLFQIALALGAPLGYAAWGGQHQGVLPTRQRMASSALQGLGHNVKAAAGLSLDVSDSDGRRVRSDGGGASNATNGPACNPRENPTISSYVLPSKTFLRFTIPPVLKGSS